VLNRKNFIIFHVLSYLILITTPQSKSCYQIYVAGGNMKFTEIRLATMFQGR
jgi:hypothetical protein